MRARNPVTHEHTDARDQGAEAADWLHDLIRSGAFDAEMVHRRIGMPAHVIRELMAQYTNGPKARLARARMLATGVRVRGDREAMWMYTTGAPDGVIKFLERSAPGGEPDAWVRHAHTAMVRRWWTLYPDQH